MDKSAGQRLREDLDTALAVAARKEGHASLEFTEVEQVTISMAAAAADRVEVLRALLVTVLASAKSSAHSSATLAGEIRLTERAVVDLVGKVDVGTGHVKSPRHVAAGRARWRGASAHF
jgi:hypothetical protein